MQMNKECYNSNKNKSEKLLIIECVFIGLYLILPDYFAIELSKGFPLMTISRILLALVMLIYMFKNRFRISLTISKNKKIEKVILLYIISMIFINLINLSQTKESVKAIFSLLFENLLLVYILTKVINTKKKLYQTFEILSISSGVVAIVSFISVFIGKNLFYYLYTINRSTLQANTIRMGRLRAEAGFGHPVYYAMYCVIMAVICLSCYINNKSKKTLYLICFILNVIGLLLSNSRGSFVVLGLIVMLYVTNSNKRSIKQALMLLILGIIGLLIGCLISDSIRSFLFKILLSLFAIVNKKVSVSGYGENAGGMSSRIAQLSSLVYVYNNRMLFGFGKRAIARNVVLVLMNGCWLPLQTMDMGIVSVVVQYGYVGLAVEVLLFISILWYLWKNRKQDQVIKLFFYVFLAYCLGLLTISGMNSLLWFIVGLFVAYVNIKYCEKESSSCEK